MKENIKIALLVVISGTLIYQTFGRADGGSRPMATAPNQLPPPPPAAERSNFNPVTPATPPPASVPTGPTTTLAFNKSEHDFGTVLQQSNTRHVFKFTNTGTAPLVISNARGSCGCTVPDYPKQPIPPGGTGEIPVEYSPGGREGIQNQTITIVANTEPAETQLRIKANVQKL